MGVPTSEVGYTSAMSSREDHEVHKGHVVALGEGGILKVKLKFSRYRPGVAQKVGRGIALLFHDRGIRRW